MFPMTGLTADQVAFIRATYLKDSMKVEQLATSGADGGETWDAIDQPLTPCLLIENNSFQFSGQTVAQQFVPTVLAGGEVPLQSGGPKYRVTLTTYKPDPTSPTGDPIPDREVVLLVTDIQAVRDAAGVHQFQILRCKNA